MRCSHFISSVALCAALLPVGNLSFSQETSAKPNLAPGSLIVVPPNLDYSSVYNRADMVEILATLPPDPPDKLKDDIRMKKSFWAEQVRYKRDIWCLQFSCKPIRVVQVDIPNTEGSLTKKNVWYLVYNVKNLGPVKEAGDGKVIPGGSVIGTAVDTPVEAPRQKDLLAGKEKIIEELGTGENRVEVSASSEKQTHDAELIVRDAPGLFAPRPGEIEEIRFVPQFILATDQLVLDTKSSNDATTGVARSISQITAVSYADQMIPLALPVFFRREGMKAVPETTVSLPKKLLKSGEECWCVAMWTDIDPRITKFSIYISGLTNDYKWTDSKNDGKVGVGRLMKRKVLKTNWQRHGDRYSIDDEQFRAGWLGTGALDYEWLFL